MTEEDSAERVVRYLVHHARCTDCASRFDAQDVHVLAHDRERVWDLAAVCNNCYTMSLIRAVVRAGHQAIDAREVSEWTAAEAEHFGSLPAVAVDDVLDMSAFLSGFDGDFRGLFGREPDPS